MINNEGDAESVQVVQDVESVEDGGRIVGIDLTDADENLSGVSVVQRVREVGVGSTVVGIHRRR